MTTNFEVGKVENQCRNSGRTNVSELLLKLIRERYEMMS